VTHTYDDVTCIHLHPYLPQICRKSHKSAPYMYMYMYMYICMCTCMYMYMYKYMHMYTHTHTHTQTHTHTHTQTHTHTHTYTHTHTFHIQIHTYTFLILREVQILRHRQICIPEQTNTHKYTHIPSSSSDVSSHAVSHLSYVSHHHICVTSSYAYTVLIFRRIITRSVTFVVLNTAPQPAPLLLRRLEGLFRKYEYCYCSVRRIVP
jgi:hypothetical protein